MAPRQCSKGTFANDTPWARSGWGIHYPADEHADASGKLEGTLQENNRAELTALVETLLERLDPMVRCTHGVLITMVT